MAKEDFQPIGICPICNSWRIQPWDQARVPWRCQDCGEVFQTPRTTEFDVGDNPDQYVLASDIGRLENLVRDQGSRSGRRQGNATRGKSGIRRLALTVAATIVVIGAAGAGAAGLGLIDVDTQRVKDLLGARLPSSPTSVAPPSQAALEAGLQPILTPAPVPAAAPEATATAAPAPTPTPTPVPETPLPPHLRYFQEKQYMLELINEARSLAGAPPVELGDNGAAQLYAETTLENCSSGHWGLDGLKPYMRYSLAGGYQSNSENVSGLGYCITQSDGYAALADIRQEILKTMDGWMTSPSNRRNILHKSHKKVNVGLAWDSYNTVFNQHFEGDYVEYERLPAVENGVLTLAGRVKNGALFDQDDYTDLSVYYDQPPHSLSRGQVGRTFCYDSGLPAALVRKPLPVGWRYPTDDSTTNYRPCGDPYDVPADAPPAGSPQDAQRIWQAAYDAVQSSSDIDVTTPYVTASDWTASAEEFSIAVDLSEALDRHGDGVYTVFLWGSIGGESTVISQYSIFHGVTPPKTYGPKGPGGTPE